MDTKHTPGPWTVTGREVIGPQDSGVIVARLPVWGIQADTPDPAPANARLIAAAPDLLRVLQLIHANAGESPEWIRARIDPIIARATGNQ